MNEEEHEELFYSDNRNDVQVCITGQQWEKSELQKHPNRVEMQEPLYWDVEPGTNVKAKRLDCYKERVGWKMEF